MKIEIDLDKINRLDISPNDYIFLYLRLLGRTVPKTIESSVNLEDLQSKGFIKIVDGGFSKRPKLIAMFKNLLESDKIENWIDEWRHLWPSGVRSGGKLVRGSKQDCTKKMKIFLERTGYTKDEVFAAAQAYCLERKGENYKFMTSANYFIKKGDDSSLEAWCEQLKEDGARVEDYGSFHKEV